MNFLICLLVIYLIFCLLLYILQPRLVFKPTRAIITTPASLNYSYEDVNFTSADGTKLHGWFIPHPNPKGITLFCHGNAGNISDRMELIEIIHNLEQSLFLFDYRGYGKSEGKPSEKGTYEDAEAAREFLIKHKGVNDKNLVIFGRSLGTSIASFLAMKYTPKALIVDSPFTSLPEVGQKHYPVFPVKLLSTILYPTADYVKKVNCPVLVIHSEDDEVIPLLYGKKIFEAANEPKTFLQTKGDHDQGFLGDVSGYREGIRRFLEGESPDSPVG